MKISGKTHISPTFVILWIVFITSGFLLLCQLLQWVRPPASISSEPADYVCPVDAEFRLVVPDAGVSVACFAGKAQKIVDAVDSAAVFQSENDTFIADHNYQGFDALKKCEIGTEGFLVDVTGHVTSVICRGTMRGYNTGSEFKDEKKRTMTNINPNGITVYTCNLINDEAVTFIMFEQTNK